MDHTELARMGGEARAKKLTKAKRREIARKGGEATRAMWAKKKRAQKK